MSYTITHWHVYDLTLTFLSDFNFTARLQTQPDKDEDSSASKGKQWLMRNDIALERNVPAQTWQLVFFHMGFSGSIMKDGSLAVKTIVDWINDGSGSLYRDVLIPLFKEFYGTLSARVVWEKGESMSRIHDGIVEEMKGK